MPVVQRDRRHPAHVNRWMLQRHPAQGMGLRRHDRVRLLRARAAQVRATGSPTATPPRRGRRWRPASTSSCRTSEIYPLLRRAGEGEGDPDRAGRHARWRACLRAEVRAGPVRGAVRGRRAGGQDLGRRRARALARKAADRSIVLLKNAGGLLPLDRARVKTLAVHRPQRRAVPPGRLQRRAEALRRPPARHPRGGAAPAVKVMWAPGVRDHARGPTGGRTRSSRRPRRGPPHDRRRGRRGQAQPTSWCWRWATTSRRSREAWAENHLGDRTSLRSARAAGRPGARGAGDRASRRSSC